MCGSPEFMREPEAVLRQCVMPVVAQDACSTVFQNTLMKIWLFECYFSAVSKMWPKMLFQFPVSLINQCCSKLFQNPCYLVCMQQESRAVARKPRDAAAVLFGLKFADNIHYKLKSSKLRKPGLELQTYWHKTKFNAK